MKRISLTAVFFALALTPTVWSQGDPPDRLRERDFQRTTDPEQEQDLKQEREHAQSCSAFIDEDGDGVCDLCCAEHDPEQEREGGRRRFIRGDADGNGWRDLTDAIHIFRALFFGEHLDCADAADVTDDGQVDIGDPVRLLRAMYCQDALPIPVPCRNLGNDPTPDGLLCE